MLRPRRNWTRGVAAQHASLSRWRSPVRIRSGPPSPHFPTPRPPARTGRPSVRWQSRGGRRPLVGPSRRLCHTPPGETPSAPGRPRPAARRRLVACSPSASSASSAAPSAASPSPTGALAVTAQLRLRPPTATAPRRPGSDRARRGAVPDRARPRHARPARRRRDRAGHPVPDDRHGDDPHGGRGRARRDEHPLRRRSSSCRARPTRSSPRSGPTARPTRRGSSWPPDETALTTDLAKNRKRLAFLRADAVGAGRARAGVGRQDALRRRPRHRPRRLAADAPRCRPRPPRPSTRRARGPCSPAATSCSTGASRRPSRSRARARTSRSTAARADITEPLLLLLVRLGPAADAADR